MFVISRALDSGYVPSNPKPFKVAGKNLAKIRLAKNLTQEKAAEKIGISLKYYQALEGGIKAPAFITLSKIRQVLRVSWDELLRGS